MSLPGKLKRATGSIDKVMNGLKPSTRRSLHGFRAAHILVQRYQKDRQKASNINGAIEKVIAAERALLTLVYGLPPLAVVQSRQRKDPTKHKRTTPIATLRGWRRIADISSLTLFIRFVRKGKSSRLPSCALSTLLYRMRDNGGVLLLDRRYAQSVDSKL